ncbi:MAG: hypothetical protein IPO39_05125 [Bacteroidetes bacterium]|nr:hypothetical protein [Bacteroidota bacterium]
MRLLSFEGYYGKSGCTRVLVEPDFNKTTIRAKRLPVHGKIHFLSSTILLSFTIYSPLIKAILNSLKAI